MKNLIKNIDINISYKGHNLSYYAERVARKVAEKLNKGAK